MDKDSGSTVTINESKNSSAASGNSTRAFAGVIGLLLVISGVYSMIEPMNQRIDFLEREISRTKTEVSDHEKTIGHTGLIQQQSITKERFKEIETQFGSLKEIMEIKDKVHFDKISCMETKLLEALIGIAKLQECLKHRSINSAKD